MEHKTQSNIWKKLRRKSFFLTLQPLGIATSISAIFFCSLSITTLSGYLVRIRKSLSILDLTRPPPLNSVKSNSGTSSLYSGQMYLYIWLWCYMCTLPAFIFHTATCWMVSRASLHILHVGSCLL